jgi:hypothetical protein
VWFHDWIVIVNLAAALAEIPNQFLARVELGAAGLAAIEVAYQADTKRDIVEIIAMDVTAVDLTSPAVADLNLSVSGRGSIPDDKMIGQTVLHSPHMAMIVVEDRGVSLPSPTVVNNDVLPTGRRHRCPIDRTPDRCSQVPVSGSAAVASESEKARPKTARPIITIFFNC